MSAPEKGREGAVLIAPKDMPDHLLAPALRELADQHGGRLGEILRTASRRLSEYPVCPECGTELYYRTDGTPTDLRSDSLDPHECPTEAPDE